LGWIKAGDMNKTITETTQLKGKGNETREKILDAAQQVFATYPYHSAGIRMISELAGVDHPLINYYFGSKADLFRAVISRMRRQRTELQKNWLANAKSMGPTRGFSIFLDFVLEDYRKRPGLLHLISLNFRQVDTEKPIPGFDLIEDFVQTEIDNMKATLGLEIPDYEAEMFIRVMVTLQINFLGGGRNHAKTMNMDPESIVYFNWVKEAILFTLLPRWRLMVQQSSSLVKQEG
jgi:AcrR family transcriptional regulator